MGYESKLIMGLVNEDYASGGSWYVNIVGQIDLSNAGSAPVGQLISESIKAEKARIGTPYGAYVNNGDNMETTDRYGDPLAPIDPQALLDAIVCDDPEYRRFALAHRFVSGWVELAPMFTGGSSRQVLLHYGH